MRLSTFSSAADLSHHPNDRDGRQADGASACDPITATSGARGNRLHGGREVAYFQEIYIPPNPRKHLFDSELRY
jgi:hypothetical protein